MKIDRNTRYSRIGNIALEELKTFSSRHKQQSQFMYNQLSPQSESNGLYNDYGDIILLFEMTDHDNFILSSLQRSLLIAF